jgi:predicted HAD superfamily phosphohydrolase YqeG
VNAAYNCLANLEDIARYAAQLSARTLVFDIEPFVAHWDSSQGALDDGIAHVLNHVATIPGVLVVCFATNSSRRPSALPGRPGVRIEYLASAGKPLQTARYRPFPRPGIVIGDQVLTDGLLARRLGYTFLHYRPDPAGMPGGPRLLSYLGEFARPFVFGRDSGAESGPAAAAVLSGAEIAQGVQQTTTGNDEVWYPDGGITWACAAGLRSGRFIAS